MGQEKEFISLLSEAKKKEKNYTNFIIDLYTNIKDRNPVKLKNLTYIIENLSADHKGSDLEKYIKLYKMKYGE
jgi:hypothetical protein